MVRKKVLITGGSGFLGRAVARKCVERGELVFSYSRSTHPELTALGVSQIQGDVADAKSVADAVKGMDVVFHLASKTGSWGRLSSYYKTNVKGTRNVIAACKTEHVKVLVYTSTTHVMMGSKQSESVVDERTYPERFSSNFAMSKAFAEQAVIKAMDDDLRTIILRPHMIWGPGDTAPVPGVMKRKGPVFRIGDGKNKVTGIFVDDAAAAHVAAAEKVAENPSLSGKAYVIVQDDPMLLWDFIDQIRSIKGQSPVWLGLPAGVAYPVGKAMEFLYKNFRIPFAPLLTTHTARELSSTHVFDNRPALEELGFKPQVTVPEGMKAYEAWLKSIKSSDE